MKGGGGKRGDIKKRRGRIEKKGEEKNFTPSTW